LEADVRNDVSERPVRDRKIAGQAAATFSKRRRAAPRAFLDNDWPEPAKCGKSALALAEAAEIVLAQLADSKGARRKRRVSLFDACVASRITSVRDENETIVTSAIHAIVR
jgi:hypothetical protein